MAPSEILAQLNVQPFQPFRFRLSNNATYDIGNPGLVIVGTRFVHIGIPPAPDDPYANTTVRVDPIHITELIPLTTPPQPQGNGQAAP